MWEISNCRVIFTQKIIIKMSMAQQCADMKTLISLRKSQVVVVQRLTQKISRQQYR